MQINIIQQNPSIRSGTLYRYILRTAYFKLNLFEESIVKS